MRKAKKENGTAKPNTLTFGNLMARWVSLASLAALVSRATRNTQKHPIKDPQQKHSLLQENGCFSIASTARSYKKKSDALVSRAQLAHYKKMVTSPILFPLKHSA